MDQLRELGKAIKNSPRLIRKKLAPQAAHHEKLEDDWYHSQDPVINGVSFYAKYLGSTEVSVTHGAGSTDEPVKKIINHAKSRGSHLQKVEITISSSFVKLVDVTRKMKLDEIPLYRVSYCTVDPYYDKVFAYIARNSETKKLECHCFLCSNKSKAEAITLTVAQAFNIAYEQWQKKKRKGSIGVDTKQKKTEIDVEDSDKIGELLTIAETPKAEATAADDVLDEPPKPKYLLRRRESRDDNFLGTKSAHLEVKPTISKAVSLEYLGLDDTFDLEFTKLAEARSNPHLLPVGEHINRSTTEDDVLDMMKFGDKSIDDKSHEELNALSHV